MKNRVIIFVCFLVITWVGLIWRLGDIQIFSTDSFGPENINLLEKSVQQRTQVIHLGEGRGSFYDRNMLPLTEVPKKDIVVFPFIKEIPEVVQILENRFQKDFSNLAELEQPIQLSELIGHNISMENYTFFVENQTPGLVPIDNSTNYEPLLAEHLLGIVGENAEVESQRYGNTTYNQIGVTGFQSTFDSFLVNQNSEKLLLHVDAKKQPLFGLSYFYKGDSSSFYPVKIKTTIDSTIQHLLEKSVEDNKLGKGGAVLIDIENRDLVAMVSKPSINIDDPFSEGSIINHNLRAYAPGSVFKTVVAAAAIEGGEVDLNHTYNCNLDLYGENEANRKLGALSFEESFAQSCNRTFAQIGEELQRNDPNAIESMSQKIGLTGPVGWTGDIFHYEDFRQFSEEEKGHIWGDWYDRQSAKAINQTAIGQKNVKITPISIANMMATIANRGVFQQVRGVERILYQNGATMVSFNEQQGQRQALQPKTAERLADLLKKVVDSGTGQSLKGLNVAGKSGTAETGREGKEHHWFAGFFPYDQPKYALVVYELDVENGSYLTYPIFREIVEGVYEEEASKD
ncbi:penicillin-binding transpeptidase domain-containing protein [Bacillaceae bacterium S4-13-58]